MWFDLLYRLVFLPDEIGKASLYTLARDKAGWYALTKRLCTNAGRKAFEPRPRATPPALADYQEFTVPALGF